MVFEKQIKNNTKLCNKLNRLFFDFLIPSTQNLENTKFGKNEIIFVINYEYNYSKYCFEILKKIGAKPT